MGTVDSDGSDVKLIVGKIYHVHSATGHHEMTYVGKTFTGKHTFQDSSGEYAFVGQHMITKRVRERRK
ncbi:MAG TPA: hypothetical protein VGI46_13015 [Candidatus Acidoferrum sp.]|jgi:hypothetical protein